MIMKKICKVKEIGLQALIERWRMEYNMFRPHSSLGYLPPVPEAVEAKQTVSATLQLSV
jgi:hypothetical protein